MTGQPDFEPEEVRIVTWRINCLVAVGFESDHAGALAALDHWRDAIELKKQGCPDKLALEILK